MATERPNKNPYSAFNFTVEINGEQIAAFQEVSGLDSENTPIEYREGADALNSVRKLPGLATFTPIVLTRGLLGDLTLFEWRKEVRDGSTAFPPVRDVVIQLQNEKHENVYKWKLTNAWPSKLSGPKMNAKGSEIAIETLEISYDSLDNE